jgi:hypothetical protein
MIALQEHADQAGTPGRVLPTKLQRFVQELADRKRLRIVGAQVRRFDALRAAVAKAAHQVTHGTGSEAEGLGDVGAALPLLGTLLDDETEGHRDRMWHEQASLRERFDRNAHDNVPLFSGGKTS